MVLYIIRANFVPIHIINGHKYAEINRTQHKYLAKTIINS